MSRSSEVERQVRIELLRARAAVERETLARQVCEVASQMTPASLLQRFIPFRFNGGGASSLLLEGVRLARRYPFVLSSVSALLGGGAAAGRARGLGRIAVMAVLGWQALRAVRQGRNR